MNEKQFQKWTERRKLGRAKFTFLYGVMLWGLLTPSLIIVVRSLMGRDLETSEIFSYFIAFPIGGIFFGLCLWHFNENAYENHLENR